MDNVMYGLGLALIMFFIIPVWWYIMVKVTTTAKINGYKAALQPFMANVVATLEGKLESWEENRNG